MAKFIGQKFVLFVVFIFFIAFIVAGFVIPLHHVYIPLALVPQFDHQSNISHTPDFAPMVFLKAVSQQWNNSCLSYNDILNYPGVNLGDGNWTKLEDWERNHTGMAALVHYWDNWGPKLYEKRRARTPIIIDTNAHENWGNFANGAPGSADWTNYTKVLLEAQEAQGFKTMWEAPFTFLNDSRTLVVLATQHRSFYHPKIVTVPLGVKQCTFVQSTGKSLLDSNKTVLLVTSGDKFKPYRFVVSRCLKKRFGSRMLWTHPELKHAEYLTSLATAKYVLGLSGMGIDCYRTWETLWMGSIPILLSGFGFESLLSGLPALFVKEWADLTPELLEARYPEFVAKAATYNYAKLTKEWWFDHFDRILATKNATNFLSHFIDPPEYLNNPRSSCADDEYINYNTSCPWGNVASVPIPNVTFALSGVYTKDFCTKNK